MIISTNLGERTMVIISTNLDLHQWFEPTWPVGLAPCSEALLWKRNSERAAWLEGDTFRKELGEDQMIPISKEKTWFSSIA